MLAKDWRFPATCPHCGDAKGMPFRAATTHESLIVEIWLRCSACKHEWCMDADNPPLFIKQKPDRRAS